MSFRSAVKWLPQRVETAERTGRAQRRTGRPQRKTGRGGWVEFRGGQEVCIETAGGENLRDHSEKEPKSTEETFKRLRCCYG